MDQSRDPRTWNLTVNSQHDQVGDDDGDSQPGSSPQHPILTSGGYLDGLGIPLSPEPERTCPESRNGDEEGLFLRLYHRHSASTSSNDIDRDGLVSPLSPRFSCVSGGNQTIIDEEDICPGLPPQTPPLLIERCEDRGGISLGLNCGRLSTPTAEGESCSDGGGISLRHHLQPLTTASENQADEETARPLPDFDFAPATRIACIVSICGGVMLSPGCVASGTYILVKDPKRQYVAVSISPIASTILSILGILIFGAWNWGMQWIRRLSIRWALNLERRLKFNTNFWPFPRLKKSRTHVWYINMLHETSDVLSSACFHVFVWGGVPTAGRRDAVATSRFGGTAMLVLGLLIGVVTTINAFSVLSTRSSILTWSSNPLNATLATIHNGAVNRRPGRTMQSVQQRHSRSTLPEYPKEEQGTMIQSRPAIRYLVAICWVHFVVATTATIGVGVQLVSALSHPWTGSLLIPPLPGEGYAFLLSLLFVTAIQTMQLVPLRCAEAVVDIAEDEAVWRRAYNEAPGFAPGTQLCRNPVEAALSNVPLVVLLVAKTMLQWLLGKCVSMTWVEDMGQLEANLTTVFVVAMFPWFVVYSVLACLVAGLVTYLATIRFKGPQPVAFGHLQTLADLIDDWETDESGRLWWGDKEEARASDMDGRGQGDVDVDVDVNTGHRRAGTSGKRDMVFPVRRTDKYQ